MSEEYELSLYQKNILKYVQTTNNNLLIDAKAGSGKTTTLLLLANESTKQNNKCLFLSFNKSIVNELKNKITNSNCIVRTVHSLGYSFIASYLYRKHKNNYEVQIDANKVRKLVKEYYDTNFKELVENENKVNEEAKILNEDEMKELHNHLISDISTLCNFSRLYNVDYKHDRNRLLKIINKNCSYLKNYVENKDTKTRGALYNFQDIVIYVIDKIKTMFQNPDFVNGKYVYTIDYTDMLYLPLYFDMTIPFSIRSNLDTIFIDECIAYDSYIQTNKGKIRFKTLDKRFKKGEDDILVKSFNEITQDFEYKPILNIKNKGIKDVYEIKTYGLNKLQATDNHPFLTQRGWVQLKDLRINEDYIYFDNVENEKVKYIANSNQLNNSWKKYGGNVIKEIKYIGKKEVFDMEVQDNHNFCISKSELNTSASAIVHNCQDLSYLQQNFIKKLDLNYNRFIFVRR